MALNRSDKSRILRRYSPGMTRNSEMSTEPSMVTTPNFRKVITMRNGKPSLMVSSISIVLLSLDDWYKFATATTPFNLRMRSRGT